MLKNNKGFTVPELIIVIAVFAILFAIVVPRLVDLNKQVKIREDVALATLLNEAINDYMTEEKIEKIESYDKLLIALEDKGYAFDQLSASNEGCYFVWESETNQILLVEKGKTNYKVLYNVKGNYGKCDESWYFGANK